MTSTSKPWTIGAGPGLPPAVPELMRLAAEWRRQLVSDQVYTEVELEALQDPNRETSWAAPPDQQYGPMTMLVRSEQRVVAGVELWHQHRDRYWFLENLVRDQSPEFKGVGHDVVDAALAWFVGIVRNCYGLHVHAMAGEPVTVRFWTRQVGREPDFADAYIRSRTFHFPAVGWIIVPRDDLLGQLLSGSSPPAPVRR